MIAFELHTEAEDELFAAAARYEERVAGLGLDFLSEVDRAMTWVGEHPLASPLWPEVPADLGIRRKLLDRFPFGLPYLRRRDLVVFVAVAHLSRTPGYWLGRAAAVR